MNSTFFIAALMLTYNAFLIGGTAYLVFWRGESGWWFLLSVLLTVSPSKEAGQCKPVGYSVGEPNSPDQNQPQNQVVTE